MINPSAFYPVISTERLQLIGCTAEALDADIGEDHGDLAHLLGAKVPESWPPDLFSKAAMKYCQGLLSADDMQADWPCLYLVLKEGPVLIGVGGFKGTPSPEGDVEIGYSLLGDFQGQGYGTEAIRGMVKWAFDHPEVKKVVAETRPELKPSIGALKNNGFTYIGKGSVEGTLRFEISRREYEVRGFK